MTTEPASQESLLETLYKHDRVLITGELAVGNGRFLQPTGFPDIDACLYRDSVGRRWCLVESEQSMANRLEAVSMRSPGVWVKELAGLPVIAVKSKAGGALLTTNLTEPHRLASSYVLDAKLDGDEETIKAKVATGVGLTDEGGSWPLDKRGDLEKLVFALDPAALVHGFQFVQWKFVGLRQDRFLHARLEAELADEPEVHYGMVKWDAIEPESTREERANKGQSIAAKSRVVPKSVTATFEIDILGIKSLAIADDQKKLVLGLALWKVGAFLANKPSFDPRSRQTRPSLRLRTDCYLETRAIKWTTIPGGNGGTLDADHLMKALPTGFQQTASGAALPAELDFAKLVQGVLGEKALGAADGMYEGPLVVVRYERRAKQGAKRGEASATPSTDDAGSESEG